MIVFVPAYDAPTESNLQIARRMRFDGCELLFEAAATRPNLLEKLVTSELPVFAMSHGRDHRLAAQNGELALELNDASTVGKRILFVFACWTAGELGPAAAQSGATWWGYTGAISAPSHDEATVDVFVGIFEMIADRFAKASTPAERLRLIQDVAERCIHSSNALGDDAPADAYLCLLHLWQRLRVWVSDSGEPERHPDAPPPIILI
jgi:hypothetical protein